MSAKSSPEQMPQNRLGKTGRRLSIIGFGGIVVMDSPQEVANKAVAEAYEAGVNYFDVAPSYGDAESKLGPALKPFLKDCFLSCKTTKRDKAGAKAELDNSLKTMQTDHFDLYQMHALNECEKDVKVALGSGGAIETFLEAKKAGIIQNIGFSAHSPAAALLAMEMFDFDTILYPVNFALHYQCDFETEVIAQAKQRGMGILAIKAMALRKRPENTAEKPYPKCWYLPIGDEALAKKALAWTLGQGAAAMLPPCDEQLFRMAMKLAPQLPAIATEDDPELEKLSRQMEPIFAT